MTNQPELSVVICTYNRDRYLEKCLEHLSCQDLPTEDFEILVINNSSTDQTAEICKHFQESHPDLHFKYVVESNVGLSHCRNRGVKESSGEIISYLDDDAYAAENYARSLVNYFRTHAEVDAIGGKITPEYQSREPAWMSNYLLPLVAALDMGNSARPFQGWHFPIGANMAFHRSALPGTDPFRTDLGRKGTSLDSGEEKDLFMRLKRQNKNIHYVPDVQVQHFIPDSRLQDSYIRRMAMGIGRSEALRVGKGSTAMVVGKWLQEFLKIGATVILAMLFLLQGNWSKASMLVKFRMWFLGSFIKGA